MYSHPQLMIVDDEEDIRRLLMKYLEKEGFTVFCAGDGVEALLLLNEHLPDIVLTDFMMPNMDGMELLKRIKEHFTDLPVLVMTAFGTIDRAVEFMKLGAADFVTKPVNLDYLLQVIQRILKQTELERRIHEHEMQLKADLQLASRVQQCMLPENFTGKRLSLHLRYDPMFEIGGDYLTIKQYDDESLAIALYDVTGHGVSAALIATMLHHQLTDLFASQYPLSKIAEQINMFAAQQFHATGLFCTMVLVYINIPARKVEIINAGHPDVLIWNSSGEQFTQVHSHLVPIGLQQVLGRKEQQSQISFQTAHRILLYTDGLIEARDEKGDVFGDEQFLALTQKLIHLPQDAFLESILEEVDAFCQQDPKDDRTLVVVDIFSNDSEKDEPG